MKNFSRVNGKVITRNIVLSSGDGMPEAFNLCVSRALPTCGDSMTSTEIKDLILEIIEDIDDEADLANLDPAEPLRDQLDLDSMDFLDIVMELRKRHQLQIPEDDYPNLATLNSCVAYLEPLLKDA